MEFEHRLAISLDVAVAISILGGVITFIISRFAEVRNANHHRSWDHFQGYSDIALPIMLKQRDHYLTLLCDYKSILAANGTPDVNLLIDYSFRISVYVQYSFTEAFENFESSNLKIVTRKKEIILLCSQSDRKICQWRKDMLSFFVDGDSSVKQKYESSSSQKEFLAFPAWELSRLYGLISSHASRNSGS